MLPIGEVEVAPPREVAEDGDEEGEERVPREQKEVEAENIVEGRRTRRGREFLDAAPVAAPRRRAVERTIEAPVRGHEWREDGLWLRVKWSHLSEEANTK
jgi:hypothetical protein